MKQEIESAIRKLLSAVESGSVPGDALKLTQSVLNLVHAQITLTHEKKV